MAFHRLSKEDIAATEKALADNGGRHPETAAALGITVSALRSRLYTYGNAKRTKRGPEKVQGSIRTDEAIMLEGERKRRREAELALAQERRRATVERMAKATPAGKAIKIAPYPRGGDKRHAAAVSVASDWHIEEEVESDKVNGRNSYNTTIAETRARAYFQGLAWKIRHHTNDYEIRQLVLFFLGDFITGYIHPELVETAAMAPARSIAWWVELATAGLEMLAKEFPRLRIDVPCVVGNHGRTTDKTRVATRTENSFEWLGYHMLAERFKKYPRIKFHVAAGSHAYVDVLGWTIRATHGDDIRYAGGVGGLSIPLRKAVDAWNEETRADYTVLGHWHQFADYGWAVGNGSLIGYSAYSRHIKARYEPPAQIFFLIDKERGKDYVSPIWVDRQGMRK